MARTKDIFYNDRIELLVLSDEELLDKARFWAQLLGSPLDLLDPESFLAKVFRWLKIKSPKIRLMKPEAATTEESVICEAAVFVHAASAYDIVIYLVWSRGNSDFTWWSRFIPLSWVKDLILREVVKKYYSYPRFKGCQIGLWMDRLNEATFASLVV